MPYVSTYTVVSDGLDVRTDGSWGLYNFPSAHLHKQDLDA